MTQIIDRALGALKAAGADGAQCWLTQSEKTEINLAAGEFSLMRTTFDTSLRMTALTGGKKGNQIINQLDDIEAAAVRAVETARASQEDSANAVADKEDGPEVYDDAVMKLDPDRLFARFDEMRAEIKEKHPQISMMEGVCDYTAVTHWVGNTNGVRFQAGDAVYEIGLNMVARDGERSSSINGFSFVSRTLDTPFLDMGNAREMLENCVRELDAAPLGEKFVGDVVLTPSVLGEVLSEYVSCFASDRCLITGTSPLREKLGQAVAGENVTVVSNPLDADLCGYRLTADGFRAQDMTLLDRGVLKSFALGQYGALKTGLARGGNSGNRAALRPGTTPLAQLIAGIEKGLLLGRFSGGSPNENGDWTGVAKNSFLIENGKVTRPVQETMIAANLLEMLCHVEDISRDTLSDGTVRQPWARVSGVTISG